MRIKGKKRGIRTSNTIRNNAFDSKFHDFDAFLMVKTVKENHSKGKPNEGNMRLSLYKHRKSEFVVNF
jgi:hypothetical protein